MNPYVQMALTVACSACVQLVIGVVFVAMMKQQLIDLVGWVKALAGDLKKLAEDSKNHEGRISHVEGRLNIPRES